MLLGFSLAFASAIAQTAPPRAARSVPTFTGQFIAAGKQYRYTVAGGSPERGGTTTIPTVLVPVSLVFEGQARSSGKERRISAASDVSNVVGSPIFQKFAFATGTTQYGDAVERAAFYKEAGSKKGPTAWHTLLGQPLVTPVLRINIPAADGYLLTSTRTGHSLAVVDVEFVKKALFNRLSKLDVKPNELVIALTKNTMFYPLNDATVCCSWGAHGAQLDAASQSAQAFILGTYLDPGVVPRYSDVQTLTEQVAEWMNDPLQGYQTNTFPAWMSPPKDFRCGGRGEGSFYRFAEPTDGTSVSNATRVTLHGRVYHLENAALLPWFAENPDPGTFQGAYSFPDTHALTAAARPCMSMRRRSFGVAVPTAAPLAETRSPNGHELIGYWAGYSTAKTFHLRDVSPQWDVVIVAFAPPVKGSTSLMRFRTPVGQTRDQFKSEIAYLQGKGTKVLISLGGGGQVVILNTAQDIRQFVSSVSAIVQEYGFNGVDLDFETPSLILNPGDTDFRNPTTPSIVNLISAMRQLRQRLGPKFMIAEVPEGPQVPAGMEVYGGQFGSFLPVIYGTRDILSFVDVQNYNTPPLEGLDGNYYMPETADYYVSMAELMVRGFPVGGNPKSFFPPLPADKVAIGFMAGPPAIPTIENALRYLIEGKPSAGGVYKLRRSSGYPDFNGAMFWNIQSDRRENYQLSNAIGPLLHSFPPSRAMAKIRPR
ncbi:MAG: glycosyl hydrolase family 18 protein [Terriglobia bacterium]